MKSKLFITTGIIATLISGVLFAMYECRSKEVSVAKAESVKYTTSEIENERAKTVFEQDYAMEVKRFDKIRETPIETRSFKSIGRDEYSKFSYDFIKKFKKDIPYSGEYQVDIYVFPDEEIFYTSYDEAVNHMIDLYESGKTGSFIETTITQYSQYSEWPSDPEDDKKLRELGYYPVDMEAIESY